MEMDKNKISIGVGVAVILLVIAGVVIQRSGPGGVQSNTGEVEAKLITRTAVPLGVSIPEANAEKGGDVAVPELVAAAGPATAAKLRKFSLRIEGDKFIPDTVVVGKRDSLIFVLSAIDKDYSFDVPDYGIHAVVKKGTESAVRFNASASDKFIFYCEQCGGPERGPVGSLIVVENGIK